MGRFVGCGLLAAVGLLATACGGEMIGPGSGNGDAQLSVLNALASGDETQLRLDGEVVLLPGTGNSTGFPIATGSHHLEARNGGGATIATADFAVAAGGHRTAVLAGAAGIGISLLVAADTASLPPLNAAKVRVVHTVQGAPAMDAYLFVLGNPTDSSARFVSPFSYGTGTSVMFPGYAVRPLGTYTIMVAAPGSTVPLAITQVTLGDGQVWSVVLSRTITGALELRPVREGGQQLQQ